MKHSRYLLWMMAALTATLALHCKKPAAGLTPTQSAEKFMKAMEFGDYREASKYATKETGDLLRYQSPRRPKPFEDGFKIGKEEISGDYARVYYTEPGKEEDYIRLKKDGDAWLVIMSKSELRPDSPFNDLDSDIDANYSVNDTLTDSEKAEMQLVAEEFLSALKENDIETAEFLADIETGLWLADHGKEEKYTSIWNRGYKITGRIFIGRTGKIIYRVPGDNTSYQLRMNYGLGTWEVSYDGPEKWDGLGEILPVVAESMEKAAEEMGNAMKTMMEEMTKGI